MTMHHHPVLTGSADHPDRVLFEMHAATRRLFQDEQRVSAIYARLYDETEAALAKLSDPEPSECLAARIRAELMAYHEAHGCMPPIGDYSRDPANDARWEIYRMMLDVRAATMDGFLVKLFALLELNTVLEMRVDEPEPENLPEFSEAEGYDRAMSWSLWRDLKPLKPALWEGGR